MVPLSSLVWEYWKDVNEEDLSEWEDCEIHPGIVAPYQKVEMKIYTLERKGMAFMGAFLGDEMVGFMCHKVVFDVVLLIDHFFVLPEYEGMGIAKGIVRALPERVKKVYFWTRKLKPPKLLGVLKDSVKLFEDDKHITWEMTWAAKQN